MDKARDTADFEHICQGVEQGDADLVCAAITENADRLGAAVAAGLEASLIACPHP